MKAKLNNKIVLITGASSGIGALVAKLLADRGAVPVLTARNAERLGRVSAEIRGEHAVFGLDVRSDEQVARTVEQIVARYGRIDVLVNNAGYGEFVPFAEATIDHFRELMDVNYFGAIRCAQAVLPGMRRAGDGHIVNIVSLAGKLATPKSSGYSASKHALLGLSNALRMELRGSGIAVSAVNPGPIDTPFFDRADPDGTYVRNVRRLMLKPERVARAIVGVIESRKAELDLPRVAGVGVKFAQLFPRATELLFGSMLNRK